ncbi:MAG TPA: glycosyltransferase family 39 protein [Candidatus Baltobacteraceae bacterium]|nr:glycosyltransferase family 39 protein [Candidatus Baltobacteraceae bacterium]
MRLNPELRAPLVLAFAIVALHAAAITQYGFYRDELYFLVCARHLAWGFADLPPLVPALAWLSHAHDNDALLLRLPVVLANAAAVFLAGVLARDLGAKTYGIALASAATLVMPATLFLGHTLTTTSFEPFAWTLIVWAVLRMRARFDWCYALLVALTCAIFAYAKYTIFLPVLACAVAALLQRQVRIAAVLAGCAAFGVLALVPNIAWQAAHAYPMLDVVRGDMTGRHAFNSGFQPEYTNALQNAPVFLAEQFVFAGLFAAPVWLWGLRANRFLAIVFGIVLLAALAGAAKAYYIVGIYPVLVAAGCAALESCSARGRSVIAAIAIAGGAVTAPLFFPLLPARPFFPNPLLADEFGWPSLTQTVARTYSSLPPAVRTQTTVYADTYGDAAALELFGPDMGLPQPISAQNQYYLWGRHGSDMRTLLVVGASQYALLKQLYGSVNQIAVYRDDYRWAAEGPTPIYLCTQPRLSADETWRRLRWMGA